MTMDNTVKVEIFNQVYSIRSNDGNSERAQRLAAKVDQHMREIARSGLTADSLKIAILAALHIADELEQAREHYQELNRELSTRSSECAEVLDQVLRSK